MVLLVSPRFAVIEIILVLFMRRKAPFFPTRYFEGNNTTKITLLILLQFDDEGVTLVQGSVPFLQKTDHSANLLVALHYRNVLSFSGVVFQDL